MSDRGLERVSVQVPEEHRAEQRHAHRGLPPHLAVQGYLLLIATINGLTVDETGLEDSAEPTGHALPRDPDIRQQAADMARDYIVSLPAEAFPNMTALADEFAFADPDERFELLIDIFIDGLARRAAQP
jgi:hypothetical protein